MSSTNPTFPEVITSEGLAKGRHSANTDARRGDLSKRSEHLIRFSTFCQAQRAASGSCTRTPSHDMPGATETPISTFAGMGPVDSSSPTCGLIAGLRAPDPSPRPGSGLI